MSILSCSGTPDFYKEHQQEYLNISNLTDSEYDPYIFGKVIVINIENGKLDDVYNKLSKDLKASNHEEVGMVIWLEWGEVLVGEYTDGWKGYAHTCDVTTIDFINSTIVDEEYFRGTDPPESKNFGGDAWGSMPIDDIVQYIEGLPRTF